MCSSDLLEHGALGIPDLPLTFALQALAAKMLQLVSGQGLEPSILLSVRLCDAALPPLAAVPVYLLGRTWCVRTGRGAWPAWIAAAVVALGAPALSMTGDFEKNSLGLVWLAGLVLALHAWISHRTRGRAAAVVALLGLCGITHIGVFGAALLLTGLTWAADLALLRGKEGLRTLRHVLLTAAGAAAAAALAAGLVLWKFDPARVRRLAGALSAPVTFLQTGGHTAGQGQDFRGGPPPGGAPGDRLRPAGERAFSPPGDQPPDMRGGVPPGMPGLRRLPQSLSWVLALLAAAGALLLPWRRRLALPAADRAATCGCAATLVLLTGPWVQGDVTMRLWLIAMTPACFCVAFALAHLPGRWAAGGGAGILAVLLATSAPLLQRGGRPAITPEAAQELRTLSRCVSQPGRTLVVARHGLEWWTAWTLHTHVAQARALRAEDWSKYAEVLFLEEKGAGGRDRGGPGGFAPPGGRGGRERPPPGFGGPSRAGGPSGFGGPGGAPPMMEAEIPQSAEVLHNGTYFRLARVREAPDFVSQPSDAPGAK